MPLAASLAALGCGSADSAVAAPLTNQEFRAEMLGVPLCGTPGSGPLRGKAVCVVHLPDGSVVVAGGGLLLRGLWEAEGDRICRRAADDPLERRRCVTYERIGAGRFRNSDGLEVCPGPCAR
jgi:hypothetical protein